MNKTLLLLAALVIAGCAAPRPMTNAAGQQPSERDVMECEYEGTKASAGIRSGIEAGYMHGTIKRQCLALKGFK